MDQLIVSGGKNSDSEDEEIDKNNLHGVTGGVNTGGHHLIRRQLLLKRGANRLIGLVVTFRALLRIHIGVCVTKKRNFPIGDLALVLRVGVKAEVGAIVPGGGESEVRDMVIAGLENTLMIDPDRQVRVEPREREVTCRQNMKTHLPIMNYIFKPHGLIKMLTFSIQTKYTTGYVFCKLSVKIMSIN